MQRSVTACFENATVGKKSIRVITKREKWSEKGCFHGEKRRRFQYADPYLKSRNAKKPCAKPLSEHRKRTAVAIHIVSQLRFLFGTPEGTRTPDLLVRSQSLYPTELPAHTTLSQRPIILAQSVRKCKPFFCFSARNPVTAPARRDRRRPRAACAGRGRRQHLRPAPGRSARRRRQAAPARYRASRGAGGSGRPASCP